MSALTVAGERYGKPRMYIKIFQAGDRSTFLHEMGHFFLESRRRLSLIEGVPQQVKDDWKTIKKCLNVEDIDFAKPLQARDSDRWRTAQEKWAAGFERYLDDQGHLRLPRFLYAT
jgi:hypothetical protein